AELVMMIHDMASGQVPPWYFMPYFAREVVDKSVPLGPSRLESAKLQPIAVQDVTWAFAEALRNAKTIHEIYNLLGPDEFTWPELMAYYREILPGTNTEMPITPINGNIAAIGALVASKIGLSGLLPFDQGQALMAIQD